jgi:hypothetical protein
VKAAEAKGDARQEEDMVSLAFVRVKEFDRSAAYDLEFPEWHFLDFSLDLPNEGAPRGNRPSRLAEPRAVLPLECLNEGENGCLPPDVLSENGAPGAPGERASLRPIELDEPLRDHVSAKDQCVTGVPPMKYREVGECV